MLSQKHLNDICLIGQGSKQCRFLDVESSVCNCLKLTSDRQDIDNAVKKYISKKGNGDYPIGDNCKGYPILYHVYQGYDLSS